MKNWRAALAGFCMAATAHAHPVHTSFAEADYNRATQKLEVAVRVLVEDFEDALSRRAQKGISLDKTPAAEFDRQARAYLAEYFTVRTRDGVIAAHRWIGREYQDESAELWLFFEIPLPGGVEGLRLRHALLLEAHAKQLNTVRVRDHGRESTLVFFPDPGEKTVKF